MNLLSNVFNMAGMASQMFGQTGNQEGGISFEAMQQMNKAAEEALKIQYNELVSQSQAQNLNELDPNLINDYAKAMEGVAANYSSASSGGVFAESSKAYEEYQQEIAPYQDAMQECSDIYSTMQSGYSEEAKLKISNCKERLDIEKEKLFENYHYKFDANGNPIMDANGNPKLFGIEDQEGRFGEPQETKYEFGSDSTTITTYTYSTSKTDVTKVNVDYDAEHHYGEFYVRDGRADHYENEEYVNLNTEGKSVVSDIHAQAHSQTINYSSGSTEVKSYAAGETAEERAMRKNWENKVLEESKKARIADKTDNGVVDKNTPNNNALKAANAELKAASDNLNRVNNVKVLGMSRPTVSIGGEQCTLDRSLGEIISNGGVAKTTDGREVHLGDGSTLSVGGSSYTYGDIKSDYAIANDSARLSEMQSQVDEIQSRVQKLEYLNNLDDEISDLRKTTPSVLQGGVNEYEQVCKDSYDSYQANLADAYSRSGLKACEDGMKQAQANYEAKVAAMKNNSGSGSSGGVDYNKMLEGLSQWLPDSNQIQGIMNDFAGYQVQTGTQSVSASSSISSNLSKLGMMGKQMITDAKDYSEQEFTFDINGDPIIE
ncbi:hypothetical protein IJT10_00835 [bacterium]|nr:hypothetical protein [bacterium]